ncbi:MAG: HEAT repeat domain-containing protein [Bryobacterales bacterium]|nr:HEAT repeat domain-containing protein [Bryobacterales bacterium]
MTTLLRRTACGALLAAAALAAAGEDAAASLPQWIMAQNYAPIRALGPAVIPRLVQLYQAAGSDERKARVAQAFYNLGWKSQAAKAALMRDARTPNADLRLQVQWALGRVSNDDDVVDVLLENMRDDANPLFRDKAACALAYDQIHLTERQKVRLFGGLIESLRDEKADVRRIAALALQIHTGQTKDYQGWRAWLEQYKSGL